LVALDDKKLLYMIILNNALKGAKSKKKIDFHIYLIVIATYEIRVRNVI
jgi:hypothetical protein